MMYMEKENIPVVDASMIKDDSVYRRFHKENMLGGNGSPEIFYMHFGIPDSVPDKNFYL